MGLETGTFIDDLVPTNPTSSDKRRFGDDHLRLIKTVLKNSFPNVDAAVLADVAELNYLQGVTANLQTQLDAKLEAADLGLDEYARLDTNNVWTRVQAIPTVDLGNQSGTISIDARLSSAFKVTLIGNGTLAFSNLQEGQGITVKVTQGAGAPFTLGYASSVKFSFGVAPVLSTQAGKFDILSGRVMDSQVVFGFLGDLQSV